MDLRISASQPLCLKLEGINKIRLENFAGPNQGLAMVHAKDPLGNEVTLYLARPAADDLISQVKAIEPSEPPFDGLAALGEIRERLIAATSGLTTSELNAELLAIQVLDRALQDSTSG